MGRNDVVKENGNKLNNINNQFETITARVDNLEKDHSLLNNKMNNTELKFERSKMSCLKLQIKTCIDEIMKLRRKNEDCIDRIVRMEADKLENNAVIWNGVCEGNELKFY